MNDTQQRILETLQSRFKEHAITSHLEHRVASENLPVESIVLDGEFCKSFMAYIPNLTDDEFAEVIDGFTQEQLTVERIVKCIWAEIVHRGDGLDLSDAWIEVEKMYQPVICPR